MLLATLGGCGTPGLPRAPSLELPEPVSGLTALRTGDTVLLNWITPKTSTDRLVLPGPVSVRVCRALGKQPCNRANEIPVSLMAEPGKAAEFHDALPPELAAGSPRLLTYSIELLNHAGQSAGPSNTAYTASGVSPAPLRALAAEVRADGVLLRWEQAASGGGGIVPVIRIHRKLIEGPSGATGSLADKGSKSGLSQLSAATEVTLLVLEQPVVGGVAGKDGMALDADAASDRTYTYSAERLSQFELDGHSLKITGPPSQSLTVVTRDVFPPAVPSGLVVLTVPEEHAIDLSWTPDTERDLAGYVLYRREGGGKAVRLSVEAVVAPSYRDGSAEPGRRYFYSVSAVDVDGNESPRSAEVEEGLPLQ